MIRKDYIVLCQECSKLPGGAHDMKINVPENLLVTYDNIPYYPVGYQISFKEGKPIHTVILHDLEAHTVVYGLLEKVEKYGQS